MTGIPFAIIWVVCRSIIGATLALGGVGKILYLRDFRKVLAAYDILPVVTVPATSVFLSGIELVTGLGVFTKSMFRVSGFVAAGLFLLFGTAVAVNLLCGRKELPCACFGKTGKPISWHLVARDVLLVALSLLGTGFFSGRLLIAVVACAVIAGASAVMPRVRLQAGARTLS